VAKTQGLEAKSNQSFTLLCPAQGYPVPTYRSVQLDFNICPCLLLCLLYILMHD